MTQNRSMDVKIVFSDDRAGNRSSSRQEHGAVQISTRKRCIWAVLQTASRQTITA